MRWPTGGPGALPRSLITSKKRRLVFLEGWSRGADLCGSDWPSPGHVLISQPIAVDSEWHPPPYLRRGAEVGKEAPRRKVKMLWLKGKVTSTGVRCPPAIFMCVCVVSPTAPQLTATLKAERLQFTQHFSVSKELSHLYFLIVTATLWPQ